MILLQKCPAKLRPVGHWIKARQIALVRLAPSKSAFVSQEGKLDSLPYIRDAVFILSGRHHGDLNDSSGYSRANCPVCLAFSKSELIGSKANQGRFALHSRCDFHLVSQLIWLNPAKSVATRWDFHTLLTRL